MKYEKHRAESGVASRRGTDEELIALLQTKGMSAVEVGVVFVPFREVSLNSASSLWRCSLEGVRKLNLHLQTNEVIGISFR